MEIGSSPRFPEPTTAPKAKPGVPGDGSERMKALFHGLYGRGVAGERFNAGAGEDGLLSQREAAGIATHLEKRFGNLLKEEFQRAAGEDGRLSRQEATGLRARWEGWMERHDWREAAVREQAAG